MISIQKAAEHTYQANKWQLKLEAAILEQADQNAPHLNNLAHFAHE